MGARIRPDMRCVHCNTTETPLWRAGPAGPKTLCNACGVRWKKTGSVIPRAKRPSAPPSSAASSSAQPDSPSRHAHPSPAVRKRARVSNTTPPAASHPPPPLQQPHPTAPLPPPDPSAVAAPPTLPSMPAPKPVSVFRVSDAGRSKYESVFSGLMAVHRPPKPVDEAAPRGRTRTQTTRGHAFFSEFAAPPSLALPRSPPAPHAPPCPSPPPVERGQDDKDEKEAGGVYVTEVHAPSPSPSPPPMPRVQRRAEGGGFTLMMAAVANERKPPV